MFNRLFPDKKRVQIHRAHYKRKADMSEASSFATNVAGSQALNRSNAFTTSATAVADAAGLPNAVQQEELDYMTADFLQQLDDRVEDDYDLSEGHDEDLQDGALENYKNSFYSDLNQSFLDGTVDDKQVLFGESKCRPENAHPNEQQLIVYQHLLFTTENGSGK